MMGPRTYNLDGSETSGDMGRAKFVRKATVSGDGKTLELVQKTTFQGPDGEVTATSRPLHVGRSVIVVQTDLRDGESRLVAQVTQAQAVLGGG